LFIRHSGGVVLTEAGTRFVRNVRRALTVLDQAAADVSAVGRGEQGVIRIGIFSSLASGFLARLLTVYGEQHPDVEIDIFEAAPADHILAVRQFRLDLAFVVGTPHLSDCDSAEFWTESIHVVLPQTHPLAAHTEILWRDLRGETFILSERGLGSEVSNFLVKHLGDLGAPPCIEWHSVGRD
ncbi:unnamed protein product, partial [Hapterophycus canaliculatus]